MALLSCVLIGQALPTDEPTPQEIRDAYRLRRGGTIGPGRRWENAHDIRGWKIRFKYLAAESMPPKAAPGLVTWQYTVRAKKNSWCSDYALTEMILAPPYAERMYTTVHAEPATSKTCK